METLQPNSIQQQPGTLFGLPIAASRYGLPEDYEKARAAFAKAEKDYLAGRAEKAAHGFLEVAHLVKAPKPETTYSKGYADMREAAYRDAALAFAAAGDASGGKKALTAAMKADPENADVLKKLIAEL